MVAKGAGGRQQRACAGAVYRIFDTLHQHCMLYRCPFSVHYSCSMHAAGPFSPPSPSPLRLPSAHPPIRLEQGRAEQGRQREGRLLLAVRVGAHPFQT